MGSVWVVEIEIPFGRHPYPVFLSRFGAAGLAEDLENNRTSGLFYQDVFCTDECVRAHSGGVLEVRAWERGMFLLDPALLRRALAEIPE